MSDALSCNSRSGKMRARDDRIRLREFRDRSRIRSRVCLTLHLPVHHGQPLLLPAIEPQGCEPVGPLCAVPLDRGGACESHDLHLAPVEPSSPLGSLARDRHPQSTSRRDGHSRGPPCELTLTSRVLPCSRPLVDAQSSWSLSVSRLINSLSLSIDRHLGMSRAALVVPRLFDRPLVGVLARRHLEPHRGGTRGRLGRNARVVHVAVRQPPLARGQG